MDTAAHLGSRLGRQRDPLPGRSLSAEHTCNAGPSDLLGACEPPGTWPDAHDKHSMSISDDYEAKILALKAAGFTVGQLGLLFPTPYSGRKSAF